MVVNEVLYVPAGSSLLAYDPTSTTENDPLALHYEFATRGEVIGTPVAAEVDRRQVVMITDSAGVVVAVDADPQAGGERSVAAWLLDRQLNRRRPSTQIDQLRMSVSTMKAV